MSRIGKLPISIPSGVKIEIKNSDINVKGKLGEMSFKLPEGISIKQEDNQLVLLRASESKIHRANHGMARANLANLVKGVTEGFTKTLEIQGVGYRAELKKDLLILTLGYSHPIYYVLPKDISAEVQDRGLKIVLKSIDKVRLGQAASDIRSFRPPEPYKGKGIRYSGEVVRIKEGKTKG